MKKTIISVSALALAGILSTAPAYANEGHSHGHDDQHESKAEHHDSKNSDMDHHSGMKSDDHHGRKMGDMYSAKKEVDGYSVSFQIMPAKPGKTMGGSHDFMIKVEQDGKVLRNIVMNTKVVHPNGKSETKKAMAMGDLLMAGYDLGHKGKHKLMVLFKTEDGKKHKAGISYSM